MKIKEKSITIEILKGICFSLGVICVVITFMPYINPIQFYYGLANFGFPLWAHFILFGVISIFTLGIAFYLNKKKS